MEYLKKYKKWHFIGIGGIGLSRLAQLLTGQGYAVSGSDIAQSRITERLSGLGATVSYGHRADNIPSEAQAVAYTPAVPRTNPEMVEAARRGLPMVSHFELLGEICSHYQTLAVAGTNGKSTSAAMLGFILEKAGLDPTVFIGSVVSAWKGGVRVGRSKYLVVEADELYRQFLSIKPHALLLTNIEADHLDYFRDLADIESAFAEFTNQVNPAGFIAYNSDDIICREVVENVKHRSKKNFGFSPADLQLQKISVKQGRQSITLRTERAHETIGLRIPGRFNAYNAAGAALVAVQLGVGFDKIKAALEDYSGIWRRFEILGKLDDNLIISDYAHHPTAVRETLLAAREFYPGKKILGVFQPHQRQRTKNLFKEFVEGLVAARPDGLILCEIYDVAGRDEKVVQAVSSLSLVEAVSKRLSDVGYASNLDDAEHKIRKVAKDYDVIVVMGAGDIYKVAEKLIAK